MMISPASLSMLDKKSGGLPDDSPYLESTRPHNQSYDTLQALVCCTLALIEEPMHIEKFSSLLLKSTRGAGRDGQIVS